MAEYTIADGKARFGSSWDADLSRETVTEYLGEKSYTAYTEDGKPLPGNEGTLEGAIAHVISNRRISAERQKKFTERILNSWKTSIILFRARHRLIGNTKKIFEREQELRDDLDAANDVLYNEFHPVIHELDESQPLLKPYEVGQKVWIVQSERRERTRTGYIAEVSIRRSYKEGNPYDYGYEIETAGHKISVSHLCEKPGQLHYGYNGSEVFMDKAAALARLEEVVEANRAEGKFLADVKKKWQKS